MLLFDTLTWKDPTGVIPWLAESWLAEEAGAAYLFRLRSGVTFHDGTPLTADDVSFTFAYFRAHPFKWTSTAVVRSADVVDARTVRVRLDRPFAPFLEDIAGTVPILPRHIWEPVADPLRFADPAATMGSGPYTLASYAADKGEYLFTARERHFAGRPLVDQLAYVPVPNQTIGLQTRAADLFFVTDYDVASVFGGGHPYGLFVTPPWSVMRLILNVDRAPLTDVRVRRAIAHALDRKDIADRVTHAPDAAVGGSGLIPPESAWYSVPSRAYPFDRGRAAALLDEAGLVDRDGDGLREGPDGAKLTLELLANPASPDGGLIIAQLREVGLACRVLPGDAKTRTELQRQRAFALALTSHIGVSGDPDFLRQWFSGGATNAFAYGDAIHSAAFDALADRQARELDVARRRSLVAELQDVLAAELPTLPLYFRRFYYLYDPEKWSRWSNTAGGIMNGIPLLENKLTFLGT